MNFTLSFKLIEQASQKMQGWDDRRGNYKETVLNRHKLVELVVLECIEECRKNLIAVDDMHSNSYNSAIEQCMVKIKKRFEIEEYDTSKNSQASVPLGW